MKKFKMQLKWDSNPHGYYYPRNFKSLMASNFIIEPYLVGSDGLEPTTLNV